MIVLGKKLFVFFKAVLFGTALAGIWCGCTGEGSGEPRFPGVHSLGKDSLAYARNFTVENYPDFKRVTVKSPWRGSQEEFVYYLKPRGAGGKGIPEGAVVVETPVRRVISLSSVYLPLLDSLGALDKLVAVDDGRHVNNSRVREGLESGEIRQVGNGGELNMESVLELSPDAILSFAVGDAKYDSHHKLMQKNIPVLLTASYMEEHPLGRAEWIKFVGLFLEKDSLARAVFSRVDSAYREMQEKVSRLKSLQDRPVVLSGAVFGDSWHVPGGKSFTARLFQDAGGNYLWKKNPKRGGVPLSLEAVYEKAKDADLWLNTSHYKSREALSGADPRYELFGAYQSGSIYNNVKRLNPWGGNDYYETGSVSPHLILKDLINIFHPGLLGDSVLYFYRKLE